MLIEDIRILNDRLDDDIDFSFIYEAFQCESCEYRSNSQRGLNVHIGKKHKNENASENDYKFPIISSCGRRKNKL